MPLLARPLMEYGSAHPLPEQHVLRAGPLTAVLEGAELRYIRWGEREVLRRIYVALRDHNWGTVPAALSNMHVDARVDGFDLSFDAHHAAGAIDFVWRGTIAGRPNGTIRYVMDGQARSTFRKNRIGLCVLHPMACAGLACRVQHAGGTVESGTFPRHIAPHQPFRDLAAISYTAARGVEIEVRLDGDVFEMEDQRNWSDASFKIYSTPLELPFPVEVTAGTTIGQSLELSVRDSRGAAAGATVERAARQAQPLRYTLLPETAKLPGIGIGLGERWPGGRELERLLALHPAHLRLDLDLADPHAAERLRRAAELGVPLLVALLLGDDEERELARLRDAVAGHTLPVTAWLVFNKHHKVTPSRSVRPAREALGALAPGALLGGGTNAYFAELNRQHPPAELLDLVCYSIVPQVHAFDNATLVENLAAQAATVESARRICGELPLAVGPVTLKPRFNPDATGSQPEPAPGMLPPEVDARQLSLLGAGWTVGSLKYLAQAGVASITYYEAIGWRGVMEPDQEPALPEASTSLPDRPEASTSLPDRPEASTSLPDRPEAFPSRPGMLFPLYHVLADAGEYRSAAVVASVSSDPLAVDGVALRDGARLRVLLANLGGAEQNVIVEHLDGDTAVVRMLDHTSYDAATLDGAAFRTQGERHPIENGKLRLRLPPYAVATIDGVTG